MLRSIPNVIDPLQGQAAMRKSIKKFLTAYSAAVAMEYALLGLFIATAIVVAISNFAAEVNTLFGYVANNI